MKRALIGLALLVLALVAAFFALDYAYPLPGFPEREQTLVVAADGTPLRVFTADGTWRYPVPIDAVADHYLEAVIALQDPGFEWHPGIDPLALLRGLWRVLTGEGDIEASITLQVVRFMTPQPATPWGRLKAVFRALQLELHHSKREILEMYINHVPFGGPLRGVGAASYAYFHKPPSALNHAQAALLAMLPNAPTALRPDLHPRAAAAARERTLTRLAQSGAWTRYAVERARQHPLPRHMQPYPQLAPLLALRLVHNRENEDGIIRTFINPTLQRNLEFLVRQTVADLPPATSAAALVVDNRTLAVRAYVGSSSYPNRERFGYVDMVTPRRPTGTTLVPFLYGFAIGDGLIHSASLLADVPRAIDGYRPAEVGSHHRGPVGATRALRENLELPAVQLLARFDPRLFVARLRQGFIDVDLLARPSGKDEAAHTAVADLGIIDDGLAASLEQLVRAYTALGRDGVAGEPRLTPDQALEQRRLLAPAAAWILRRMLTGRPAPNAPGRFTDLGRGRRLAWFGGASANFRDRWAIGVTGRYTVGVWVGRPDGTALPDYYEGFSAVPLLFDAAAALPDLGGWLAEAERPATVTRTAICWPLGTAPEEEANGGTDAQAPLCDRRRKAWTIAGRVPPTLDIPNLLRQAGIETYHVNPASGLRVTEGCGAAPGEPRRVPVWPILVEPWLPDELRLGQRLPGWDPSCPATVSGPASALRIDGLPEDGTVRAGPDEAGAFITLSAPDASGPVTWLVNDRFAWITGPRQAFSYRAPGPGHYRITAIGPRGGYDQAFVQVLAPRGE